MKTLVANFITTSLSHSLSFLRGKQTFKHLLNCVLYATCNMLLLLWLLILIYIVVLKVLIIFVLMMTENLMKFKTILKWQFFQDIKKKYHDTFICVVFLNSIQTSLLYVYSFVTFFTLFQPLESSTFQHTPWCYSGFIECSVLSNWRLKKSTNMRKTMKYDVVTLALCHILTPDVTDK